MPDFDIPDELIDKLSQCSDIQFRARLWMQIEAIKTMFGGILDAHLNAFTANQKTLERIERKLDGLTLAENNEQEIVKKMAENVTDLDTEIAAGDAQLAQNEADEAKFESDVTAKLTSLDTEITNLEAEVAAGNTSPDLTAEITSLQAQRAKLAADDATVNSADAIVNPPVVGAEPAPDGTVDPNAPA